MHCSVAVAVSGRGLVQLKTKDLENQLADAKFRQQEEIARQEALKVRLLGCSCVRAYEPICRPVVDCHTINSIALCRVAIVAPCAF